MNKKENQRTRLTKMLFKDGLIALLQKKNDLPDFRYGTLRGC